MWCLGGFLFDGAYDRRRDLVRGNHSHFAPGRFVFGQALLGDVGPSLLIAVGNRKLFRCCRGPETQQSAMSQYRSSQRAAYADGIAEGPDIIETASAPKISPMPPAVSAIAAAL